MSAAVDKLPERPEYAASKYTKRDNIQSLFGVQGIPGDNRIRNIVDEIEPGVLNGVFNETLKAVERSRIVKEYRVLDGGVLPAPDGVWYFNVSSMDKG